MIETATVVHIYPNRVWIEDGICGDKRVMIQSEAPGSEPFAYCTFHYDYAYTSNATIWHRAEEVAVSLGATKPVERRFREYQWPAEADKGGCDGG